MLETQRREPYDTPLLFPRAPRLRGARRGTTPSEFAEAVARLERRLGELPDERMIAEELRWSDSQSALGSLGQEARATGLVRMLYDDRHHRRYRRR